MMRSVFLFIIAGSFVLALPEQAWAYVDPGTSSMAYQALLAGALAVGFLLRRGWRWLGGMTSRRRSREIAATENSKPNRMP